MLKNIEKSTLYGTHQKGLVEITMQTEKVANRHQKMHDKIHSDCASRLREWKKGAYHTKARGIVLIFSIFVHRAKKGSFLVKQSPEFVIFYSLKYCRLLKNY